MSQLSDIRLSRAGGNPARQTIPCSGQMHDFDSLRDGLFFHWIPAYAGMTVAGVL